MGGLLAQWLGWRAALLALTVYATATLALVALRMPETIAQKPPGPATRHAAAHLAPGAGPPQLLGLHTAHHGHLWGLFTFLAASSFVFIEVLQLTRTQ